MPQHKAHESAQAAVLIEHPRPECVDTLAEAAAEDHGRYQEYLRLLDDVPVLVDVVREPQRVAIREFRLGQRPDARKAPREDAGRLREQHTSELAERYAEYVESCARLGAAERAPPRKAPRKPAPKKKRAKRFKRSARSKS